MADEKRENKRKERKTESGAYIVEGVAPQAGTKLTEERMAKSRNYLRFGYDPEEKIAKLEARIEQLTKALELYADAENWIDDIDDWQDREQVIWSGPGDKGPDFALVALSDLKKEEER